MHTHTPPAFRISTTSHTYTYTHTLCNIREKKQAREEVAERQKGGGVLGRKRKEVTRKDRGYFKSMLLFS